MRCTHSPVEIHNIQLFYLNGCMAFAMDRPGLDVSFSSVLTYIFLQIFADFCRFLQILSTIGMETNTFCNSDINALSKKHMFLINIECYKNTFEIEATFPGIFDS